MNDAVATIEAFIVVALGLSGVALFATEMATWSDPHAALKALGGLATYFLVVIYVLFRASRA